MMKTAPIKILCIAVVVLILTACNNHYIPAHSTSEYLIDENEQSHEIARLQDLIAELKIALDEQAEAAYTALKNPIDQFFADIDDEVYFHDTTWSMVLYGVVVAEAWRAELENFRGILLSRTENEFVKETLNNEIYHFMEYTRNRAEMGAMLDASNAFGDDVEGLSFGSLARITRSWIIAEGYRSMALSLLGRIQMLDSGHQFGGNQHDFSAFVFDAEYFIDWMRQEYPVLWRA